MAYNSKAKIKVLYLLKIFQEETDGEHGLTMAQIIDRLNEYGVSAERKSIYADIATLREFDIDIKTYRRNPVEYGLARRDFSLGELMLMVDAVQSCRAITDKQSKMLITNIKTLASDYEQDQLNRNIHVAGRVKSKNESVFGNVDAIHEALRLHCKLAFHYQRLGIDGTYQSTRGKKKHAVTPVAISYEDGFYYLSAWDDEHGDMAEFRLDRMDKTTLLKDEPATQNAKIANFAYEDEAAVAFGRFKGKAVTVTLAADPDKVEIITDRFGETARFLKNNGTEARVRVKVYKSEQFFGWIAGMGKTVRIVSPNDLVNEYRAYLRSLLKG